MANSDLYKYIREKRRLLNDFMIYMTADMQKELEDMYPDINRMDAHVHKWIWEKLNS